MSKLYSKKTQLKFVNFVLKFEYLAFVYIAKLSTKAKLYYDDFQNFGITLMHKAFSILCVTPPLNRCFQCVNKVIYFSEKQLS